MGCGSIPLVLEVKSQGQLEVQLDCPALMGPPQGIVEVHVNLEGRGGGRESDRTRAPLLPSLPASHYLRAGLSEAHHPALSHSPLPH